MVTDLWCWSRYVLDLGSNRYCNQDVSYFWLRVMGVKVGLLVGPSERVPLGWVLDRFIGVRVEVSPLREFGDLSTVRVRPSRRYTNVGLFIVTPRGGRCLFRDWTVNRGTGVVLGLFVETSDRDRLCEGPVGSSKRGYGVLTLHRDVRRRPFLEGPTDVSIHGRRVRTLR